MKIKYIILTLIFLLTLTTAFIAQSTGRIVRQINNDWEFIKTDFEKDFNSGKHLWEKVNLPHTWNNRDAQTGEGFYRGTAWYQKSLTLNENFADKRIFLRFEGVGHIADVYVNGKFIGNHKGSYAAFCFEITKAVTFDSDNKILVRVNNEAQPDIIPQNHFLFTIFGGIYRPVSLIITEKLNITPTDYASAGIFISQENVSKESAQISLKTKLENKYSGKKSVEIKTIIRDKFGSNVTEAIMDVDVNPIGILEVEQKLTVQNPHLWQGRKDPYLYKVVTQLILEGNIIDEVVQPLGIRYFRIDTEKGFFLNGEPYRLYGVTRHQEWQDYGNALSNEQHKTDMDLIYEIGATSIRLAHYQQSDYIYSLADSMGFVIWAEIPFVNSWSGEESENVKQQLIELIRQNYNHPSIFIWGLHNEIHNKPDNDYPTQLTKTLNNIAKSEDPDRYTVSVSNIWWILKDPIHYNADLQGFNQYSGWYGDKPTDIEKWIVNTKKNYPDIPFCVSEYGAGANLDHQSNDLTPPDPKSPFFPEGYQTYYHEVKWSIFEKYNFIWSTYLWNMFDFTCPLWERGGTKGRNHKGIMTYDRKIKKDAFYWYKANWSDEPVLYITARRFNKRDTEKSNFTVYCNFGEPILEVNGKVIEGRKIGRTSVHFVWENVELKNGENNIKAFAVKDGKTLVDAYKISTEY